MFMLICKFCNSERKNYNSLINHERLCPSNPNKQKSGLSGKGRKSWNKGLTKEIDIRVQRGTNTLKSSLIDGSYIPKGIPHSDEMKHHLSERKKALYASGWEPTCGRCKKYDYNSPIAGKIKVDGTWELKVAQYLDSIDVVWERNKTRFPYIKLDGKKSTYQPDFWIESWNTYLEVKGYETDLDRCKWAQFKNPLIIWKKKEIQNLENVSDRV